MAGVQSLLWVALWQSKLCTPDTFILYEGITTMSYDDEDLLFEEEAKHAKRGACLALIIFPPLVCCILWVILSFTPDGQSVVSRGYLYLTYHGLSIHDLTQGFPGVARTSCALDRQNPRPQNYQAIQENFEAYYSALVSVYRDSWNTLKTSGEDVGQYEDPTRIPSDLARGKQLYCR